MSIECDGWRNIEEKRNECQKKIVEMARDDPKFKKTLFENPNAAVNEVLKACGVKGELPGYVNCKILWENATDLYIIMPHHPADPGAEADAALQAVSGGEEVCGSCVRNICGPCRGVLVRDDDTKWEPARRRRRGRRAESSFIDTEDSDCIGVFY